MIVGLFSTPNPAVLNQVRQQLIGKIEINWELHLNYESRVKYKWCRRKIFQKKRRIICSKLAGDVVCVKMLNSSYFLHGRECLWSVFQFSAGLQWGRSLYSSRKSISDSRDGIEMDGLGFWVDLCRWISLFSGRFAFLWLGLRIEISASQDKWMVRMWRKMIYRVSVDHCGGEVGGGA